MPEPRSSSLPMFTHILRRAVAGAVLSIGFVACAHPSSTAAPSDRPNRSVITEAELPQTGAETVYDVIQRMRPEYFRQRPSQSNNNGAASQSAVAVFANGQLLGSASDLRRIPASSVKSIRHYSIEEGKQRFGMQYGGGIIELTYRM